LSDTAGGRVFFSNVRRSLEFEDEIRLTSVGVDIGSSTSHLVFSRLLLERLDNRYVVSEREVLHESEVLLTPYAADQAIDADALRRFVDRQYALAGLRPDAIDSGALILTGVAVRRRNARAIGELFAAEAGKLVAVSAGDALEATLAAFGSGAAARSIREAARVMNVDIGGGTAKIAVCEDGAVVELSAIDIGARILAFDGEGRLQRIEEAGSRLAAEVGLRLAPGERPDAAGLQRLVERMADRLFESMQARPASAETLALLRLEPLAGTRQPDVVCFSGGVSEYLYGRTAQVHGDLGPALARAVLQRAQAWGPRIEPPDQGIRATVVGASQYTVQVSGSTIFVEPPATLPLRNVPVITPALPLGDEPLDTEAIAAGVRGALRRMDLQQADQPVALCYRWQGSATYARLDAFCRGLATGLSALLERGLPLVLVGDGDIGGLVGIHAHSELKLPNPVVSIDGIVLQEFDFIDIGALLETSGAVPVVIKSLVFPQTAALGRDEVRRGR
jgi:ethanolamine utilization protein EutA